MKQRTKIDEVEKLSERVIRRWENEDAEVLEIAKLKTVTATEDRQNDGSGKSDLSAAGSIFTRKRLKRFLI